jgi:hypothetical protein
MRSVLRPENPVLRRVYHGPYIRATPQPLTCQRRSHPPILRDERIFPCDTDFCLTGSSMSIRSIAGNAEVASHTWIWLVEVMGVGERQIPGKNVMSFSYDGQFIPSVRCCRRGDRVGERARCLSGLYEGGHAGVFYDPTQSISHSSVAYM